MKYLCFLVMLLLSACATEQRIPAALAGGFVLRGRIKIPLPF